VYCEYGSPENAKAIFSAISDLPKGAKPSDVINAIIEAGVVDINKTFYTISKDGTKTFLPVKKPATPAAGLHM
jgi:hypothetical protein